MTRTLTMRKDADAWTAFMKDHRDNQFPYLGSDQVTTITEYLIANFTPDKPVPQIPPEYAGGGGAF